MNLAQLLVRAAHCYPNNPAVLRGTTLTLNYAQLADRAARLAAYFKHALGLQKGERVLLYMTNHVQYLEILYGAWWAGLAVVPVNAKLHAKEVQFILQDSAASVLFVTPDLQESAAAASHEVPALKATFIVGEAAYEQTLRAAPIAAEHQAPDALAWLFYTSGTTGKPKGVMQTHRNLYAMTSCYFSDVDSVEEGDAIIYAAPMSHGAGLYNFAFVARAARHVIPESGGFDTAELIALSDQIGQLCLFAAPTMVKRLVDDIKARSASSTGFKTIVYGGGPMYVQDIQDALTCMGSRFVQIYGQGESPMTITVLPRAMLANHSHPNWLERLASVGHAQTLVEVRVADEHGGDLPLGSTGEVVVRGDVVMAGYWRNAQATAHALRDGWLFTGDLGSLDAAGLLTLKDRSKDVIISGGSNIYPREVEEVLLLHPAVREASVIGRTDPEWGEIVVAFLVLNENFSQPNLHDLDALCLDHIARFKRPKHYYFVSSLPKNNYGKVLKTALREQVQHLPN